MTSIGGYAFADCSGLTSVTIPDSVTSIGNNEFYGCSGLTSVIIGNGLSTIPINAFYGCSKLISIVIPDTVINIEISEYIGGPFVGCNNLTIIGSGNTSSTAYRYAMENNIKYVSMNTVVTITLDVTTNVNRDFIVYILDSNGQPTRQFVVTGGSEISFQVKVADTFTVQVYEALYSVIRIDGENRLKKTYSNLTEDTTINISISGVTNINNWIMI